MPRILLLLLFFFLLDPVFARESVLDKAIARGYIVVGTTADYHPFTYQESDRYGGFDIELARLIAAELGVEVRFVHTTWSDLTGHLKAERFDLAVGGITRTLRRQQVAAFTEPVHVIGKCPLVRAEDANYFTSLESIDKEDVIVAVNPGGTNEAYVRRNLNRAKIMTVEDNLSIPELVATGGADVMITDNVEAVNSSRRDPRLVAVSPFQPWTRETLGLMTHRDDQAFLNWLNLFLYQVEADGRMDELRERFGLK